MKITLGRIILIMTLICIFLGISNALKVEWSYLLSPFIAELSLLTNGKLPEPPELKTVGQFIPLMIGVFINVALNAILVITIPIMTLIYLWEITKYKGK